MVASARLSLAEALDGVTRFAVFAFAAWTLVYDIGLAARLHTSAMLAMWAVCLAVILAGMVRFRQAGASATDEVAATPTAPATTGQRALGLAGIAFGVAAGIAAGLHPAGVRWGWAWGLGGLSVAAAAAWLLARGRAQATSSTLREASPAASVLAACTAAAAAVLSLYLVRRNGDDTYYISRSVWAAQHGQIPMRDILFTNQSIKPIAGEPPISSIEVLIGAVARLLGVSAGSVTYFIALPVLTFFAVWGVWLLIRRWAPRQHGLAFVVAMVYLAWSGASGASFGAFHLVRMWQGKAAFVSVMVPLLYVYLTDWAERRSRRDLLLLAAAGIAAAGLSSASVYVVPLMTVAVAGPLVLARQFRAASGAMLAMAYPVVAGLAVIVLSPLGHVPNVRTSAPTMWSWVLMTGAFGVVGAVAVWTAPRLARAGAPALITAGIAAMAVVLMTPVALARIEAATGVGPVAYRMLWVVPGPVLVGLLGTIPLSSVVTRRTAARFAAVAPAVALAAVLLAFGVPLWSYQSGHTKIATHPSWKYDPASLAMARRVLSADRRPGDVLSTWQVMEAIPLLTTRVRAVNPRSYYLHGQTLAVSPQFLADRLMLTGLADGFQAAVPTESAVRAALARVGVGYACIPQDNAFALRVLRQAGLSTAARLGAFQCLQAVR